MRLSDVARLHDSPSYLQCHAFPTRSVRQVQALVAVTLIDYYYSISTSSFPTTRIAHWSPSSSSFVSQVQATRSVTTVLFEDRPDRQAKATYEESRVQEVKLIEGERREPSSGGSLSSMDGARREPSPRGPLIEGERRDPSPARVSETNAGGPSAAGVGELVSGTNTGDSTLVNE